jgi:hypothetical protein
MSEPERIHVYPIDDLFEHTMSIDCDCEPRVEQYDDCTIIIHKAYDLREVLENIEAGTLLEATNER